MFFGKFKIYISLFLFLGLVVSYSHAQDNNKFAKMDIDGNSSISWEEFSKQYPQMKKVAFASIDTNKDDNISADEWKKFQDSHKMDKNNSPTQMKKDSAKETKDGKPEVFTTAPTH